MTVCSALWPQLSGYRADSETTAQGCDARTRGGAGRDASLAAAERSGPEGAGLADVHAPGFLQDVVGVELEPVRFKLDRTIASSWQS